MKRRLKGRVLRDSIDKTTAVVIEKSKLHPIYKKKFVASKKFLVHDEVGVKKGDLVVIEETRPISKNKKWKIVESINEKEVI